MSENAKLKPQSSPPSSLKREVPTWFQNDGCSEEKKSTQSNSYSCPVTPVTTTTACTTERSTYSPTAVGKNQLTLPPVSCHCSHSPSLGTYAVPGARVPISLIPLGPSWLVYRDPATVVNDALLNSPSASPSSECSSPLDLSCKSSSYDGFESDADCESPSSILRTLLSPTQNGPTSNNHAHLTQSVSPSSGCSPLCVPVGIQVQIEDCDKDAPPRDSSHATFACYPDTPVRLAKKNIYPVTARVSQWLTQIVKFAQEVPSFKNLPQNEQVHVLQNSWHRLLLLCMAEDNFLFAVSASPVQSHGHAGVQSHPAEHTDSNDPLGFMSGDIHQHLPTVRFVETIQSLIRKMQAFKLDHVQYSLLSTAVLFYTGNIDNLGLLPDERIHELKRVYENVLTLLREHMMHSGQEITSIPHRSSSSSSSNNSLSPSKSFVRDNVQVYAKLLRILPTIYSVQKCLVHALFCSCVGLDVDAFITSMLTSSPSQPHDAVAADKKS